MQTVLGTLVIFLNKPTCHQNIYFQENTENKLQTF